MTTRFSSGATTIGITVVPLEQRSDFDPARMRPDSLVWKAIAVFTTLGGSWEVDPEQRRQVAIQAENAAAVIEEEAGGILFGIEQWARDAYLFPPDHPKYLTEGGAERNILVCVQGPDGERLAGAGVAFTSDGIQWLQPPGEDNVVLKNTKAHGWGDVEMYASSICRPPVPGPWSVTKLSEVNASDLVTGMGMPWLWHVSQFIVYRAMRWDEYQGQALTLFDALKSAAQAYQVLQLNPGAALQRHIFGSGEVPTSPEFDLAYGGVNYRCQRSEDLGTGMVACHFCVIPNWDQIDTVTWAP